jgi:hypothetical protein|tara:strand:+ start:410 stop:601 length:192 start_codon:yes stop_codon:yes gene_type:complete
VLGLVQCKEKCQEKEIASLVVNELSEMVLKKLDKVIARIPNEAQRFQKNTIKRNIEDKEKDDE